MLLQFTVKNFRSFKDEAVLSLEASSDKEHGNNVTEFGSSRILNSVALFGANAAGKSNLFLALTAAILIIRKSNNRQINEPINLIEPYRFDAKCMSKPTSFEFVFIADGKKYVYGFSATREKIVEEYLYVYNSAKASTVFERKDCNKYRFTESSIRRELAPIVERNSDNKLLLSTATAWNCESTLVPFLWFSEKISTYSNSCSELFPMVASMFSEDKDESLREFTRAILREADVNINNYEFESHEVSQENIREVLPDELGNIVSTLPPTGKIVKIETVHTVKTDDGDKNFHIPLHLESQGTQNLFMLSPILKRAFERGETLCVDEFDASLHPLLVIYLFKLFNNPNINKANAQLIVSVHSMELLSLDNLRRDQIYFVEKDSGTAASELYSLDEFSPRKDENVSRAYLLGRYGSLPDIPEEAGL